MLRGTKSSNIVGTGTEDIFKSSLKRLGALDGIWWESSHFHFNVDFYQWKNCPQSWGRCTNQAMTRRRDCHTEPFVVLPSWALVLEPSCECHLCYSGEGRAVHGCYNSQHPRWRETGRSKLSLWPMQMLKSLWTWAQMITCGILNRG